ncbi:MAG: hypothetical protein ACOYNL_07580 [Rickettsiales bacterium]
MHQSGIAVEIGAFGHADRGQESGAGYQDRLTLDRLTPNFDLAILLREKEPGLFSDKRQKRDPLKPDGSGFNLG